MAAEAGAAIASCEAAADLVDAVGPLVTALVALASRVNPVDAAGWCPASLLGCAGAAEPVASAGVCGPCGLRPRSPRGRSITWGCEQGIGSPAALTQVHVQVPACRSNMVCALRDLGMRLVRLPWMRWQPPHLPHCCNEGSASAFANCHHRGRVPNPYDDEAIHRIVH